jgi:hypothetical protein
MFAAPAAANEQTDRQALDFAIGFCGALVGEDPAGLQDAAGQLKGVTLGPAKSLDGMPPRAREMFAKAMNMDPGTQVHGVRFEPVPSAQTPMAFLRADLKDCHVIALPTTEVHLRAAERIAADPEWHEINAVADKNIRAWQRKRANGTIVTLTVIGDAGSPSINLTTSIDVLLPTIAEFDAFARAVVTPCAQSALNGGKINPAKFATLFDAEPPAGDGRIMLVSKRSVPGGRLLLVPEPWGTTCVMAVYESEYSFDYYRRAFNDAFGKLKGAARSQGADKRWVAPGPNPDHWAGMGEKLEEGMLAFLISRD